MALLDKKLEILQTYFGYTEFRPGQEPLIDALLSGRDALGIMPTGGGKSLCYQVPALAMPGITLVVSPLISLMQDQVAALKQAGVAAAYINSSLTPEQIRTVYKYCAQGRYKIIYIAPERLLTPGFLRACQYMDISMLAVDEAHCISQWGQDFRPSYTRITEFLGQLPRRPVVCAFTATATQAVREDIRASLHLEDPMQIVTGFDRPNLRFEVRKPQNKMTELLALAEIRRDKCGIVYCATRKDVEKVCDTLRERGFAASRYHAGLSDQERQQNQEDFLYDRCRIMVATNAFGMGIDKSNVSFVIHYSMPKSLEAYYQEAGRAGRDGSPADCILLSSGADVHEATVLINTPSSQEELSYEDQQRILQQDLERLKAMVAYCRTDRCLRGCILDYFGQEHEAACGNCSNCCGDFLMKDITADARSILGCVSQIRQHLGYSLGESLVVLALRGSQSQRIRQLGLHQLEAYGSLRQRSAQELRQRMEALEDQGFLKRDISLGILEITPRALDVLEDRQAVTMRVLRQQAPEQPRKPAGEAPEGLYDTLRGVRAQLARAEHVPAYIIFSNATLQDMADKAPATETEFLEVSGVGQFKARKYAQAFLTAIRNYKSQ